ncbi:hypothetical protein HDU77_009294, partial [Chytriomyces hyalinus]
MQSSTRQIKPVVQQKSRKAAVEGAQSTSYKIVEMDDNLFDVDDSSDDKGADENSEPMLQPPVLKKAKTEPTTLLPVICMNEIGSGTKKQIGAAFMSFDLNKPDISIYEVLGTIDKHALAKWTLLSAKLPRKAPSTISGWITQYEEGGGAAWQARTKMYLCHGPERREWVVSQFHKKPVMHLSEAKSKYALCYPGSTISAASISIILKE